MSVTCDSCDGVGETDRMVKTFHCSNPNKCSNPECDSGFMYRTKTVSCPTCDGTGYINAPYYGEVDDYGDYM